MCGICGKVALDSEQIDEDTVRKMVEALKHRGPDDGGTHISESKGMGIAALGHRRLSVIDLSDSGHQPMSNEDGTIWITYNGEIYNFQELKSDLEKKGHVFKSHTDTEAIIHLYEELGVECIKQLRGMFAFAIWDQKRGRLVLSRDRMGQKPLNYVIGNNQIVFASEIASMLEDSSIRRSVNIASLHNYLTYGYVPAPETMFEGIKKLPPAHTLVWERGKVTIERYWSLTYTDKLRLNEEEYCRRIVELFGEATKIRMVSDVPLGAFLSGGIDSAAVVAMMSRFSDRPVKTYSIGFEEKSFDELKYARIIASFFSTEHKEYIVKPNTLDVLPELIERFGEPFADSSSIPAYYLSRMTRAGVTVALNGDAGDESFGGYDRYLASRLIGYYSRVPVLLREKIIAPLIHRLPESAKKKDLVRRIRRFIGVCALPPQRRYISWMSVIGEDLKQELYSTDFKNRLGKVDSNDYLLGAYAFSEAKDFLDATLFVDTMTYLPNDLLVKADITSMANSLEVRSPFLDHKLVEFAASIPSALKIKGLTSKYILKRAFKKMLPAVTLRRRKYGFGVPVGKWFRREMKDYAYEILLGAPADKRGYFNKVAVRNLLDQHVSGRKDRGHEIWTLLNLELWHRRFIDG